MVNLNDDDRVVAMTIAVYTDAGVLDSTQVRLSKVDIFSEKLVVDLIEGLLIQEITNKSALPYTQAQLEDKILGLTVVKVG